MKYTLDQLRETKAGQMKSNQNLLSLSNKFVENLALIEKAKALNPFHEKPKKRIRQSGKPILNKLEQEFFDLLSAKPSRMFFPQAITFKLCNGVRLTPDIVEVGDTTGHVTCHEIKGPYAFEDSLIKLKFAAKTYPLFSWYLHWKQDGMWETQRILP